MPNSADYESVYHLLTQKYSIAELQHDDRMNAIIKTKLIGKLLEFPDIQTRYSQEPGALDKLLTGQISLRSLAPVVWLNASLAAFEVIYAGIIGRKDKAIAPKVVAYDYIQMKMVQLTGEKE